MIPGLPAVGKHRQSASQPDPIADQLPTDPPSNPAKCLKVYKWRRVSGGPPPPTLFFSEVPIQLNSPSLSASLFLSLLPTHLHLNIKSFVSRELSVRQWVSFIHLPFIWDFYCFQLGQKCSASSNELNLSSVIQSSGSIKPRPPGFEKTISHFKLVHSYVNCSKRQRDNDDRGWREKISVGKHWRGQVREGGREGQATV